ncbi:MAG: NAD(P)/FAD-dependent oxidoreductase [Candidatus Bathyarchaeota archaeon]|nr:MAG: NAD(P)/FAD-dependent oxidoreductase [Candidatus Bathyarchaeota archaeon]
MSKHIEFDVIVVGAGPAGLNTAIMCATRHLKVGLFEKARMGGLLTTLYPNKTIPNYPGFPKGIVSIELVRNWLQHLRHSDVAVRNESVTDITKDLTVTTDKKQYSSKAVVIATGTKPRKLGIPNESRFSKNDRGVYYFPYHPEDFLGKKVVVIGGGDTAIDAVLELLNLAEEITLVHRRETFRAFDENVEKVRRSGLVDIIFKGEVTAIKGRSKVERVMIHQEGRRLEKNADAVVVAVGLVPNDETLEKLGLATDDRGFITTDRAQKTNVEGVFAVGDVTHVGLRLITVAAAHGAIASHHIYSYIKDPYWARKA